MIQGERRGARQRVRPPRLAGDIRRRRPHEPVAEYLEAGLDARVGSQNRGEGLGRGSSPSPRRELASAIGVYGAESTGLRRRRREARAATGLLLVAPPLRAGAGAVLARALVGLGRDAEALVAARDAFATLEALGALEEGETLVRWSTPRRWRAPGPRASCAPSAPRRKTGSWRGRPVGDPGWRARFLHAVPDNARTLELEGG